MGYKPDMNNVDSNEKNQETGRRSIWDRIAITGIAVILIFSTIYYLISRNTLSTETVREPYSRVETVATVGEMTDGTEIRQTFSVRADFLTGIMLRFTNYENEAKGKLYLELLNSTGALLADATVDTAKLENNADYFFNFQKQVDVRNDRLLTLAVRAEGGQHQSSVTMWTGVEQPGCQLLVNGTRYPNTLYIEPAGYRKSNYTLWHWAITAVLILLLGGFCLYQRKMEQEERRTAFSEIVHVFDKYRFLLTQLVSGDFKNKYRRSYLGIVWSLLNPLLMMIVMSIVFSVVFRFSSIPNYQVYLILGQVMFSFYSESTQVSVMTIVGSGQLIKKVYLPKYIFPLSKVVFSFINTSISFIAVFLVMIYYHVPFTLNILYLPMIMVTFFLFCLGIGFILSAMMVFIRDTLHLYGIVVTILGYMTPIFYSIDIFPSTVQTLLKINPLYHYITAIRTILLYGQPVPVVESIICIGVSLLSLSLGVHYFNRRQKKFILYI